MSTRVKTRVAFFGTHPRQFNGYSKVVYELCKSVTALRPDDIDFHVFGFQNFHDHPGHRRDVPHAVTIFDANANEEPKAGGFGFSVVKRFVEEVKPDVCVVFNDMLVLTNVLNELKEGREAKAYKVVAYIDQVYLCQRREFVEFVNQTADGAIAFTPEWMTCIQSQGLRIPCSVSA